MGRTKDAKPFATTIPEELQARIRAFSEASGLKMSAIFTRALKMYFKSQEVRRLRREL